MYFDIINANNHLKEAKIEHNYNMENNPCIFLSFVVEYVIGLSEFKFQK